MFRIIKESKSINPEKLPKSIRRYAYMIEDFEKSNEYSGDNDYWCYLIDGYETEYGTGTIHDSLSMIRAELKDIEKKYNKQWIYN